MANRANIRANMRDLINDTAGTPLWSDSALNAALSDAVARYGAWRPIPSTETLTVVAGVTSYGFPGDVPPDRPIALYTADMQRIPSAAPDRALPSPSNAHGIELAFWVAGSTIHLTRDPAALAGNWILTYNAPRSCPTNDTDPMPIVAGDEPIVLQIAAAQLFERRALDDAKHGPATATARAQMQQIASYHRAAATALMRSANRRARGGSLQS